MHLVDPAENVDVADTRAVTFAFLVTCGRNGKAPSLVISICGVISRKALKFR